MLPASGPTDTQGSQGPLGSSHPEAQAVSPRPWDPLGSSTAKQLPWGDMVLPQKDQGNT